MAAMKPRTGDGPLEVTKEGRSIILRMPLEGGGRLVVEMTPDEATALGDALTSAVGCTLSHARGPSRPLRARPGDAPGAGPCCVQRSAAPSSCH